MTKRRLGRRTSALTLYFLAPFVGEGLLGNVPITGFAAIIFLAPLYGGGALLIREVTCRLGADWPTRIAFAAAYAFVEEAVIDQMVFAPQYLDLDSFAGYAPIPGIDTSATLIAASLTMHTIWSICVPIALVEVLSGESRAPWLRFPGTVVVSVLFVLAGLIYGSDQAESMDFVAGPVQYGLAGMAVVACLLVGIRLRTRRTSPTDRPVPPARVAGVCAFGATSGYWIAWMLVPGQSRLQWLLVGAWCLYVAACGAVLVRWSRSSGWTARHRLAVVVGALATYGWVCPIQTLSLGAPLPVAVVGWFVYAGVAALAARAAWLASRHTYPVYILPPR